MNQVLKTIAEQINAKELKFAKFQLLADESKNEVTVMKGKKFIKIQYSEGSDLYNIQKGKIRGYDIIEDVVEKGFYADQLQGIIQDYFPGFEYVMDSIRIVGVNA